MSTRRLVLAAVASTAFVILAPAFQPRLAPAAAPTATAPASAPATLPADKTVGKQLTAAITELTIFAHPDDANDLVVFDVTFTNTSQTDLKIDLKEVAVTLDPNAKGAPGKGLASVISVDKKLSRGMPTAATVNAGKTSVIRYSAPGLSGTNNTGKNVYVTVTFSVGDDTLSVRRSAAAEPPGPKGG